MVKYDNDFAMTVKYLYSVNTMINLFYPIIFNVKKIFQSTGFNYDKFQSSVMIVSTWPFKSIRRVSIFREG
jgi:hypothetical protein